MIDWDSARKDLECKELSLAFSKITISELFFFFLSLLGVVAITFSVAMSCWLPSELLQMDTEDKMWEKPCKPQILIVSYTSCHWRYKSHDIPTWMDQCLKLGLQRSFSQDCPFPNQTLPAADTKKALGGAHSTLPLERREVGGLWLFDMHLLKNKWTTSSIYTELLITLVRVRWSLRADSEHNNLIMGCRWDRYRTGSKWPSLMIGNPDSIPSAFVCLLACLFIYFQLHWDIIDIRLYKFKVFNMLIWYTYTWQNLLQPSSSTSNREDNYILVWNVLAHFLTGPEGGLREAHRWGKGRNSGSPGDNYASLWVAASPQLQQTFDQVEAIYRNLIFDLLFQLSSDFSLWHASSSLCWVYLVQVSSAS